MNTAADTPEIPEGEFSVEDLAMLHPAERAVVEADIAADKAAAETDAPADEQAVAEQTVAAAPPPETPPAPVGPPPHARAAELQEAIKTHDAALEDLQSKYDDGEITSQDFRAQLSDITAKKAASLADLKAVEVAVQVSDQEWHGLVKQSLGRLDINGPSVDLTIYDNVLKSVETNYPNIPDPQKVQMAEDWFRRQYRNGVAATATPPAKVAEDRSAKTQVDPEDAEAFANRVPDVGRMPGASYDPGQGQFDSIQSLIDSGKVHEAEAALARLSDADLEAFLERG